MFVNGETLEVEQKFKKLDLLPQTTSNLPSKDNSDPKINQQNESLGTNKNSLFGYSLKR